MFQRLYGVYDRKANVNVGPFMLFAGDAAAVRDLTDVMAKPGTVMHSHPGDFVLKCYAQVEVSDDMPPRFDPLGQGFGVEVIEIMSLLPAGSSGGQPERAAVQPVLDERQLSILPSEG